MNEIEEIKLRLLGADFGEGKYVTWKDGDTKKVLISNWGCYDKKDEDGNEKLAFRCNVLNVDGKEYILGQKIIDTTSINFHKAIKPFVMEPEKIDQPLHLEITRIGEKKKTTFQVRAVK